MIFSKPVTAAASSQLDCDANPDDAFCNGDKGRDGLPFCDIVRDAVSCYDRNDNPKDYCENYREDDKDFGKIIVKVLCLLDETHKN